MSSAPFRFRSYAQDLTIHSMRRENVYPPPHLFANTIHERQPSSSSSVAASSFYFRLWPVPTGAGAEGRLCGRAIFSPSLRSTSTDVSDADAKNALACQKGQRKPRLKRRAESEKQLTEGGHCRRNHKEHQYVLAT